MFPTPLSLDSLDGSNGFVIRGANEAVFSGASVSSAGDVNGDGIDDVIIGAPFADVNYDRGNEGESYIVFGSNEGFTAELELADLNGSNGFVLRGVNVTDRSGISVSGAGDVNGDGIDDVIIGAPNRPLSEAVGESYVVFGSNEGFTTELELADLDGSNGFVLSGIDEGDRSGYAVSGAGDINGDGIDDVIIGARNAEPGGESYIVFGSDEGFNASFDLANLDGSNGFVLRGSRGDLSGRSVSSAGDVNGDGIDDVIIGASFAGTRDLRGESYVVFGSSEGRSGELDLTSLNGSNGFVLRGIDPNDFSGSSVSGAGDVNGDGIDDVIIGTDIFATGDTQPEKDGRGESYVVFGSSEGMNAELDLATLDGSNGFVLRGINVNDRFGRSVSGAGDINGDGIDDVVVGAPFADVSDRDYSQGESYVIFGSSEGFDAEIEVATLDGDNGFILRGIDEGDNFGTSVSDAGDVNGDGIDDIIIGTYGAEANKSSQGESYVIFGIASNNSEEITGTEDADILTGTAENDSISGLGGDDSLRGFAGADTISGGDGADTIRGNLGNDSLEGNNGFDNLFGDCGDDTLEGGEGNDLLFGNNGVDVLVGGNGNDFLQGDAGSDYLDGGIGDDTLFGGNGIDSFVLKTGEGSDLITDYFDGTDKFLLADGLEFEDLSIVQNTASTQIELTETDEVLATLNSITANFLNEDDFVSES